MATRLQQERESKKLHPAEERREVARAVVIVGVLVIAVVFAVLNLDSVRVDWIVGSSHAPLIIVIAISMLAGLVIGWLGQRFGASRRRRH
jgi:uncharacterized integral membrane protein